MMKKLILCLTLLLLCTPTFAQEHKKNIHIILSAPEKTESGPHQLALNIHLDKGWHTYYKDPGESGLPPRFDWSHSTNAKNFKITNWPEPLKIKEFGFKINGYKDNVILPITFETPNPSEPTTINLTANIMICNDICIPETLEASLKIPPVISTAP